MPATVAAFDDLALHLDGIELHSTPKHTAYNHRRNFSHPEQLGDMNGECDDDAREQQREQRRRTALVMRL
jgi:hypothetical protein